MALYDGVLTGYRGHIDAVEPVLSGWVTEIARPEAPVDFRVGIDAEERIAAVADRPRPDVAAAGLAGMHCGFAVALPLRLLDGAEHALVLLLPDGCILGLPGCPPRVALGPVPPDLVAASGVRPDAVLDLLRRTDAEAGFDPALIGPANAAAFNAIASPDEGFVFYARAGKRFVGYGRLERGRHDMAGLGVVALTVLAAYRRKGLGEALLRTLLDAAAAAGLDAVWLSVRSDNMPARHLYEKLRFRSDAVAPPGRWAIPGEITMVRRLR
jgi:ribosomal protein S18 acetylase RimI-like enzyme